MASSRTIEAPGIELREIDRSSYNLQDNSLPNAPIALVTGVATKGESYIPQWINSKQTFIDRYGAPETEFEKYFYNACNEILNRGGVCIASKLPYNNVESNIDGNGNASYSYCLYSIDLTPVPINSENMKELKDLDSELVSYLLVETDGQDGKMNITELDELKTSIASILKNKIRIVDISRGRFTKTAFNTVDTAYEIDVSEVAGSTSKTDTRIVATNDCLGIFPVITTPVNAMYFLQLFNTISSADLIDITKYNPVNLITCINPATVVLLSVTANLGELSSYEVMHTHTSSFNDETLSKIAALQFPLIGLRDSDHLDTRYLKHIGVVVFKAYTDPANSNMVNYLLLESFVGSLDKTARSEIDNSSTYIDNVVNNNSNYINVFTNINPAILKSVSTLYIKGLTSKMLGFFEKECEKNIDVSKTILNPLSRVFDLCKDPNLIPLDIVVDAGVSNTALFYESYGEWYKEKFSTTQVKPGYEDEFQWKLCEENGTIDKSTFREKTKKWNQVLKKFDDFCHYTRRDCMFIADGLRPFCLIGSLGNQVLKIVRNTKIGTTVEKDIVPLIRSVEGINSSYAAGYCDWFLMPDAYSGDLFWCPPSIKAASIYTYCDTYFHSWDAPAGMTRGIVPNVVDVAFTPNKDDAGKIYQQSWNYAINYPLDGIIMEGQKTFLTNRTALDRINVRRLLLKLEKQVVRAAKYFLYEGNTPYLRQKFVDTIRPFFENAVSGAGIIEYAIKCDDELNTPQTIENHELHCKIALKPVKTIEYIVLSFICTSQSANVTEEVAR